MKRFLMSVLAISLCVDLGVPAQAQDDAQAKTQNSGSLPTSQPALQTANTQAVVRALTEQLQAKDNFHVMNQAGTQLYPLNDVAFWVEGANRNSELGLTPADDALRAHLRLSKDQGLIVTSLAANTSAAQAGLQQNDVLLSLGHQLARQASRPGRRPETGWRQARVTHRHEGRQEDSRSGTAARSRHDGTGSTRTAAVLDRHLRFRPRARAAVAAQAAGKTRVYSQST